MRYQMKLTTKNFIFINNHSLNPCSCASFTIKNTSKVLQNTDGTVSLRTTFADVEKSPKSLSQQHAAIDDWWKVGRKFRWRGDWSKDHLMRWTTTALLSFASPMVRDSSVNSTFGNVVIRIKLDAAYWGRELAGVQSRSLTSLTPTRQTDTRLTASFPGQPG